MLFHDEEILPKNVKSTFYLWFITMDKNHRIKIGCNALKMLMASFIVIFSIFHFHLIIGFGPCPVFRPLNETSSINCDAISTNSYRCYPRSDELVQTRCRPLATCDQAVLISGGWNRLTSPQWYKENLNQIYKMLRSNGYHKSGIKIFYANGDSPLNGNLICFDLIEFALL